MSADALSPKQFAETTPGQVGATAAGARNHCASVSHEFTQHLRRTGHPQDESGYLADYHLHVFEGHPKAPTGHIAPVLNGNVVDWTAKQLDPKLKHPHIEPFDSYRRRFKSDRSYGPYNGERGWKDAEHPR